MVVVSVDTMQIAKSFGDYPEGDLAKLIVSSFYQFFDVAEVVIIYQKFSQIWS